MIAVVRASETEARAVRRTKAEIAVAIAVAVAHTVARTVVGTLGQAIRAFDLFTSLLHTHLFHRSVCVREKREKVGEY